MRIRCAAVEIGANVCEGAGVRPESFARAREIKLGLGYGCLNSQDQFFGQLTNSLFHFFSQLLLMLLMLFAGNIPNKINITQQKIEKRSWATGSEKI